MNNFQIPYIPFPNSEIHNQNIELEIIKLKKDIKALKEKINRLENTKNNDYLKKDDGLYMI